ncbi:MAG: hypothetical protein IKE21_01650, partial [Erysipelotrichaceae bacterium]|nr:hypothetical protein [Erysipelotrichaceae bacterium]
MSGKRILSIFLSLFIMLTSIGVNVRAEDGLLPEETPVSVVEEGEGTLSEGSSSGISLSDSELELTVGDGHSLSVIGTDKSVSWSCSDHSVVTVDGEGYIAA